MIDEILILQCNCSSDLGFVMIKPHCQQNKICKQFCETIYSTEMQRKKKEKKKRVNSSADLPFT